MKKLQRTWNTSRRRIDLSRPLVMGILNVTPDSFSDGGKFADLDAALRQAEKLVAEGADIIDIGGESTRPGSSRVTSKDEIARVVPIIDAISKGFDIPISVDSSKSEVAAAATDTGAEIINDISGLRFDPRMANVAAKVGAGLVLMHSRGTFEEMHELEPVDDIFADGAANFRRSISLATNAGVRPEQIVLDIGIGFGKTFEQNLQLIGDLNKVINEFPEFPMLVGTSRKSFIGKILGGASADQRQSGSIATAVLAAWNGASIIRAHEVKATVDALKIVDAIGSSI